MDKTIKYSIFLCKRTDDRTKDTQSSQKFGWKLKIILLGFYNNITVKADK